MTVLATIPHARPVTLFEPSPADPKRALCPYCDQPVLHTHVNHTLIVADIHEWEPRAQCGSCLHTRRAHPNLGLVSCSRCGDTGMIGTRRPPGWMLAIDMAWSDIGHVRIVGPRTDRRRGEALHVLHICAWT